MKTMRAEHKTAQFWLLMWGLGLAGQLCWNIENQWFNTFVYAKIAKDSTIVTVMVIVSALVTTFSTFLFGTLSDRRGSRRHFISIGYIAWGVCTILFGFTEFISDGAVGTGAKTAAVAAVLVVLTDAVMSFFGSMGNDSGYSAWSNDMTTGENRGQVGAVLAIMPVIGTIIGTVLGGLLIGGSDNYQRLFWAMGLFVIAVGLLSLIFLKDAQTLCPHKEGSFWQQFCTVFSIKGFFAQKELLLTCITAALFFIPFNIYFVHMGNWMIYRMGFAADGMGVLQGVGLLAASLLVIPAIGMINRHKIPQLAAAAIVINMAGLWIMFCFIRPDAVDTKMLFSVRNLPLLLAIFLCGAGYVLVLQSITMWVKQLYPKDSRGQFEGMRVLFFTLIPMFFGTVLGNIIVKNGSGSIINAYGITENIPTESIYLWAALLVILAFVPLYYAAKLYKKRVAQQSASTK